MSTEEQLLILLRVAAAAGLGGVVGIEREWAGKAAGVRTHMFVAATAALLVALGPALVNQFHEYASGDIIGADPIRIVQAIVTGISFLGAGTIIFHRERRFIEGLTTAASILLVSGLGITVGLEQWVLAVGVTVLAVVILAVIGFVETKLGLADHDPHERRDE
ncbi:MAG: MgtC/SapB family protein [Phycisphaerae bacterium]|nr:MgtC/SapB family protein [Phycisphaerae bacterium]